MTTILIASNFSQRFPGQLHPLWTFRCTAAVLLLLLLLRRPTAILSSPISKTSSEYAEALTMRGIGEQFIDRGSEFLNLFDGLELAASTSNGESTKQLQFRIGVNTSFWLSITPCSQPLAQCTFVRGETQWNPTPEQRQRYILDMKKEQNKEQSNEWIARLQELHFTEGHAAVKLLRNATLHRQDFHYERYPAKALRVIIDSSPGAGFMVRFSTRQSPLAGFNGYPRLPTPAHVDVCTKEVTFGATLEIEWRNAVSDEMDVEYCVAINIQEPLWNRCSAQARLDSVLLGRSRQPMPFKRHSRRSFIRQAVYKCTLNSNIQVHLPHTMVPKDTNKWTLFVNVYAVNNKTDLSTAYVPWEVRAGPLKSCGTRAIIRDLNSRDMYIASLMVHSVIRLRDNNYNGKLFYQPCRVLPKNHYAIRLYAGDPERDRQTNVQPLCDTGIVQSTRRKICQNSLTRRHNLYFIRREGQPGEGIQNGEPLGRVFLISRPEKVLPEMPQPTMSGSNKKLRRRRMKIRVNCMSRNITVRINTSPKSQRYCIYIVRVQGETGNSKNVKRRMKTRISSIRNLCVFPDHAYQNMSGSYAINKFCVNSRTNDSRSDFTMPYTLDRNGVYIVLVYMMTVNDRLGQYQEFYKENVLNMKSKTKKCPQRP